MSDSEQELFDDMEKRIRKLEFNLRHAAKQLDSCAEYMPTFEATIIRSEARMMRGIANWKQDMAELANKGPDQ
ncbi:hypothetical protein [Hyphomonas sp.]|uniref:hypothetical protein n=1 Tax=Hyphomonas sp. TaxID=87 RepID=UPI003002CE8B